MSELSTLPDTDTATHEWFTTLQRLQRDQWDTLMRWQQMLLEWQQDAFDTWVSHWGGGVPIDA